MELKASWLKSCIKTYRVFVIAFSMVLLGGMHGMFAMDATPADTALMAAIVEKNVAGVRVALAQEVHINLKSKNHSGHTPLSEAVAGGNIEIVELLLKYPGIELDTPYENNWTVLHIAAHHKYANIVRMLLRYGATPHVVNADKNTPLHLAANHCDIDSVKALITQITHKKLWAHVRRISFPLLCCFNRFAAGQGVAVRLPKDIKLLLCRYAIKAQVSDMVNEQISCVQLSTDPKTFSQVSPFMCAAQNKTQHDDQNVIIEVLCWLCPFDRICKKSIINNYLLQEIDQLNLTSKPRNLDTLQNPPTQDME